MKMPACCFVLFAIACRTAVSDAASRAEEYELREKCGKRAAELFKQEFGTGIQNTKNGQLVTVYRNHYSAKLNKCFLLLTTTSFETKKQPPSKTTTFTVVDINENREYGSFTKIENTPFTCYVLEKTCVSEQEWNSLIRVYMDE